MNSHPAGSPVLLQSIELAGGFRCIGIPVALPRRALPFRRREAGDAAITHNKAAEKRPNGEPPAVAAPNA
ncbi:hypothetical protein POW24_17335 [Pseudomonas aeruginosa]|nr:hypothetical protein [Pseudomonas aeruginosa]